jgi:hypothetical protein
MLAAFLALLPLADAHASKTKLLKNNLLTVVTPAPKKPAIAHPFVNVIVLFGALSDGTPADPKTFHARLGREDITGKFAPVLDTHGRQIGVRAKLEASQVKIGRRPRNHLRLVVQAKRSGKGPRIRDTDRLRFSAVEGPDSPPSCLADADSEIIVPGIPIHFTGDAGSEDPDRDELTYSWDFGDGTSSTDPDPEHTYEAQSGDVTVTLTCSDGQLDGTETVVLLAVPKLPAGKTAGQLFVSSATALEFGGVAPGASGTKIVTLQNTDTTATSDVEIRLAGTNPVFALSATSFSLGPGESQNLTITFQPSATGHQHARVGLVAAAANRNTVSFLAHGFGGTAPDDGPTLAADPVFYTDLEPGLLGLATFGFMPDGRRFESDSGVNTCFVPGNGLGTLDYCIDDQDCAANGGTCSTSSTCPSGANAGGACTLPTDCPGSFCPSYTLFDPVDLCSDGQDLYLLSDEGTFSEPDPNAETERSITVMRMVLDPNGNTTKKIILDRTTTETGHIACDGIPASQGGQLYIPEFHNVPDQDNCFRSEREALVRISKQTGTTQVVPGFTRIDIAEGLGDCDDLDSVDQLELTRDASKMAAGFDSGGLWQIRPTSIFYSPDITDTFQMHPDGTVMFAAGTDSGSTGLVNLYRITPDEVQHGSLPFSALVPCASFAVPNNLGRTVVIGFGSDRQAVGSETATALVSFVASAPNLNSVESSTLLVKGTVAFTAPPNDTSCSIAGLVNLEQLELAF